MASRRRDQILDNCRWLYGHEVQILTFAQRRSLKPTGASELRYYAAVLPRSRSLVAADVNSELLLKEHHPLSTDGATSKLLDSVERKIGEVLLQVGAGREAVPERRRTPGPQVASAKTTPVVPEQTKRFFEALLENSPAKPPRFANPSTLNTRPIAVVSEHSLSLLDVHPQRRDIESRIAEVERRLHVLDAAVESLCQSRDTPIMTPATSVASTAMSRREPEELEGIGSGLNLGARAFLFA